MNALLALHPCKAFGRSTSGIHARPRKRVRFCCSVKPSQLWWALLPIRTINEIFRTIPITKLASLVKGEVLSPEKIRATTGGIVTPPTFFKTALSLAQHHVLASPRKRGGGTAVEVFRLAVQYSDSPAFTILKLFRAVTVGIAPHPHYQ